MKTLVSWLVRLALKPALSAGVPVSIQRAWSALIGVILIGPKSFKTERIQIAGIATTVITPASARPGRAVLFFHGGGYVVGGAGSHTKLAAQVGQAYGARVWLPEYRLAPEHPCPAALEDALALYKALLAGGQDPAQISLCGDSAGGGLALTTAIAVRDARLPQAASLALLSPWVDLSVTGPTITTHASRDAMLSPSWGRFCAEAYRGIRPATDPLCSPLFADLRGLPPMLIHVGSEEILLSDATRLAHAARAAGVAVVLRCFDGVGHVFQFHTGLLREADESVREIGAFMNQQESPLAAAA